MMTLSLLSPFLPQALSLRHHAGPQCTGGGRIPFPALLSSRAELLHWPMLPWLIARSFLGGLIAYAILIGIVGARRVRTLYQRYELTITRLCGVMFIGFAINALWHAVPGLLTSKE